MELNVSAQLTQRIDEAVNSGRYENANAMLLDALRLLNTRDRIRDAIRESLENLERPETTDAEEVLFELYAHAAKIASMKHKERERQFQDALDKTIERYGDVLRRLADS